MLNTGVGLWQFGSTGGVADGADGSSFDPASLTPLAWWDISDISTLFKDTAGAVPVTADGDVVARISDKSGNGNHATQATALKRPTYRTSGGLHWLELDGTDDTFDLAGIAGSQNMSIYQAFDRTGNAIAVSHASSSPYGPFWLGTTIYLAIYGGTAPAGSQSATGAQVMSGISGASTLVNRRNGAVIASAASGFGGPGTFQQLLGRGATVSAGKFYGCMMFASTHDAGQIASCETWIGAKAGLTL